MTQHEMKLDILLNIAEHIDAEQNKEEWRPGDRIYITTTIWIGWTENTGTTVIKIKGSNQ